MRQRGRRIPAAALPCLLLPLPAAVAVGGPAYDASASAMGS
jgi:hypothetical protein